MAKKTPLQLVNDKYGSKEKLVDKLVGQLDPAEGESKDEFRARLLAAPNTKLLRLVATLDEVQKRFGGKDKLIDAILELEGRKKDEDYRTALAEQSVVRLMGHLRDAERRAAASAKRKSAA
ncbi:MAG: hypothetical protein H6707_14095 [Deltaproteobacteria bacterium]|nr:hypothetical protein [Deltaproteobacteria bacterium]